MDLVRARTGSGFSVLFGPLGSSGGLGTIWLLGRFGGALRGWRLLVTIRGFLGMSIGTAMEFWRSSGCLEVSAVDTW